MLGWRIGCTNVDHFLINRGESARCPADHQQRVAAGPCVGWDADRGVDTFAPVDSQSDTLTADVNSSLLVDEVKVEARPRCLAAVLHGDMHASRFSGDGGLWNFDEFHLDALMGFGGGTSQKCSDECQYESGRNVY